MMPTNTVVDCNELDSQSIDDHRGPSDYCQPIDDDFQLKSEKLI